MATKRAKFITVSDALHALQDSAPQLAETLRVAEENRLRSLNQYLTGARLKGYEELLEHLGELAVTYSKSRKLKPISFLIWRARGDFQIALEAAMSGYHTVAHDAMRDVMEIEFLLRDFFHDPAAMLDWLRCTPKERHDRFRPAILRSRHARRVGMAVQDMAEAADYKAHSMLIHVSPLLNPFGPRGLHDPNRSPFVTDSCFWEIFEHARRLLFAAHRLRRRVARHVKSPWGLRRGLRNVKNAWERTQEMQSIYFALLGIRPVSRRDDSS